MMLRFKYSELVELANSKISSLHKNNVSPVLVKCVAWTTPQYLSFEKLKSDLGRKILLIHLPEVFDDLWVVRGSEVSDDFGKEKIQVSRQAKKLLKEKVKFKTLKSKRLSKVVYMLPAFSSKELNREFCFFCGGKSFMSIVLDNKRELGLCLQHHKALNALVDKLF